MLYGCNVFSHVFFSLGYGKRSAALYDDSLLTNASQEIEIEKISPETFKSLLALKASLGGSGSPRLGEVVRQDANVRPSEGRYDAMVTGPGRGGWMARSDNSMEEEEEKPPGV